LHVISMSFFFSSRRRHTRFSRDWSSDVCSSDLAVPAAARRPLEPVRRRGLRLALLVLMTGLGVAGWLYRAGGADAAAAPDPDAKIGRASCRERVWSGGAAGG